MENRQKIEKLKSRDKICKLKETVYDRKSTLFVVSWSGLDSKFDSLVTPEEFGDLTLLQAKRKLQEKRSKTRTLSKTVTARSESPSKIVKKLNAQFFEGFDSKQKPYLLDMKEAIKENKLEVESFLDEIVLEGSKLLLCESTPFFLGVRTKFFTNEAILNEKFGDRQDIKRKLALFKNKRYVNSE